MVSILKYFKLFMRFPLLLIGCIVLMLIDTIFALVNVASVAPLMDLILQRPENEWLTITHKIKNVILYFSIDFNLITASSIMLITMLGMAIFSILIRYGTIIIRAEVIRKLTIESFSYLYESKWDYIATVNKGKLVNSLITEINKTGNALTIIAQSIALIFRIIAFIALPIILLPKIALVCITVAGIGILPFLLLGRVSYRIGEREVLKGNRFMTLIKESLDGAKEIISFARQKYTLNLLDQAYTSFSRDRIKGQTLNFASAQIYEPIGLLAILSVLITADTSSLPLSELGLVAWGFLRAIPQIKQLIHNKHQLDNLLPSLEQVLSQQEQAIKYAQHFGNEQFDTIKDKIVLEDITYRYPGDDNDNTLENINMIIPKHSIVAIVGESGSGKSTLLNIIVGLLEADKGTITINGIKLKNYNLNEWREKIALVSQNPVLFDLSIRENILWSKSSVSDEKLLHTCRIAGVEKFINKLPQKMDTKIGDLGVRLSGGQLQRLALARALVRDPQLLLLDEATSALDSENEANIFKDLYKLQNDMTILVIAHRLSTVVKADIIYVMNNGKIIDQGDYNSLMKHSNYFNKLVNLQKL